MSAEELKARLERFAQEAWHQGNLAVIDELMADGFVLHDPVSPIHGPEAFKQYVTGVRLAFPDLQFTVDDIIVEGSRAVARWAFWGTHTGQSPSFGIPPTGKQVRFSGVSIYHMVDDKIVEEWSTMDTLGMLKQLGVTPPVG
jgi:predicted ester cyclase